MPSIVGFGACSFETAAGLLLCLDVLASRRFPRSPAILPFRLLRAGRAASVRPAGCPTPRPPRRPAAAGSRRSRAPRRADEACLIPAASGCLAPRPLRLDHVVGVDALRRLHAVELASEGRTHQLGGVHGALRCGAHSGDLDDQARVPELQVGRHRVTGIRAAFTNSWRAVSLLRLLDNRLTITVWSEKRVYGLFGLMRPSVGLRAISSGRRRRWRIDQDVAGRDLVFRGLDGDDVEHPKQGEGDDRQRDEPITPNLPRDEQEVHVQPPAGCSVRVDNGLGRRDTAIGSDHRRRLGEGESPHGTDQPDDERVEPGEHRIRQRIEGEGTCGCGQRGTAKRRAQEPELRVSAPTPRDQSGDRRHQEESGQSDDPDQSQLDCGLQELVVEDV